MMKVIYYYQSFVGLEQLLTHIEDVDVIIVSSIQMDAGEVPFENIKNLLPFATKIEVCPAVCTKCDQDAYYTKALFDIENATQEEKIGSKDMYEPRCTKHYL